MQTTKVSTTKFKLCVSTIWALRKQRAQLRAYIIIYSIPSMMKYTRYNDTYVLILEKNFNISTNQVCRTMVHNPIYDGPVYESVPSQFETPTTTSLQAAFQDSAQDTIRYTDQPSQPQKRSLSSNAHAHSLAHEYGNDATTTAARMMVLKKDGHGQQQNELNHTLFCDLGHTTGTSKAMKDPTVKEKLQKSHVASSADVLRPSHVHTECLTLSSVDETYTVMNPAGTLTDSSCAGWDELSPEDA